MRLQRFLAQAGVSSRRRAEALIASGAVRVNGEVVSALGSNVNPSKDRVEVDGRRVHAESPIYRLVLKPRACLATLTASGARPTLKRYLRDAEPGWQVVAPLDFPAEGVVLVTNDGALGQALAKSRVPMTYHVKLQGMISDNDVERLAVTEKNSWVEMVVGETRPRALKAAGDLIRHSVLKIARVRLGGLSFEGLKMGGWRDLTKVEAADLRKRAGLEGAGVAGAGTGS